MSQDQPPRDLPELRDLIDRTDQQLIELLGRRRDLVAEVARFKTRHGTPVYVSEREAALLEARRAEALAAGLQEALGIPAELCDERLTTVEAERLLGERRVRGRKRRKKIDQVAAAVILQGYLDSQAAARGRESS